MAIKLFVTERIIDAERIKENKDFVYKENHLFEMFKQGKCKVNIGSKILMMKDSIYMTDSDREKILHKDYD